MGTSPFGAARLSRRLTLEQAAARANMDVDAVKSLEDNCIYRFGSNADALAAALGQAGIGHKAYYRTPTHRQPAMAEYGHGVELPVTDEVARTHLAIPMSPVLDGAQAEVVVAAARSALTTA